MEKEILELAKILLKKFKLCDTCIGRQFRFWREELQNEKKGRMLREKLGFKKVEKCELCNNIFEELPSLTKNLIKELKKYEFQTFIVGTKLSNTKRNLEEQIWEEIGVKYCESIKNELNRTISLEIQKTLNKKPDFSKPELRIIFDLDSKTFEIVSSSIYLFGTFKKRKIINESIYKIFEEEGKSIFKGERAVFYTFGKLEKEVLLSADKPFVLKIENPKKREVDLKKLISKIRKRGLNVTSLQYSQRVALFEFLNKEITQKTLIKLKANKKIDFYDIERLKEMEGKEVCQKDEYGKEKKLRIKKVKIKTRGKSANILLYTSPSFLVYKFTNSQTTPNLKDFANFDFEIKKVEILEFEIK